MNDKDICDLLNDTLSVLDGMSKSKAKKILRILTPIQQKYHCDISDGEDWIARAKKALIGFINQPNLVELFDKRQIKSLYSIVSEYQIYPICPLCGKPIKKYSNNKLSDEFTWDHTIPKSLGGSDALYNMQPTHKDCNNNKGNNMLYHVDYNIEIVVNINFSMDMSKCHHRKNLHKKDYWRQARRNRCR